MFVTKKCGKGSSEIYFLILDSVLILPSSQLRLLKLFKHSAVAQTYALHKKKLILSTNYYCSGEFMCSSPLKLWPEFNFTCSRQILNKQEESFRVPHFVYCSIHREVFIIFVRNLSSFGLWRKQSCLTFCHPAFSFGTQYNLYIVRSDALFYSRSKY